VPAGFRMSIVSMKDGRIFTGVVLAETEQVLTLQTQKEQLKLARKEVDVVQPTPLSLMPDGLFNNLKEEQIVNLIAYLMGHEQVPLPAEATKP
jgi:putative heme-binding domain-containing protein